MKNIKTGALVVAASLGLCFVGFDVLGAIVLGAGIYMDKVGIR